MSDYTVEERLEGCRRSLLRNSIFFCIGWFVMMVSMIGLNYINPMAMTGTLLAFLGWVIIGGPRIWKAMLGGFGAAFKADYEVVTYRDGVRVSSDGGAESMQINFLGKLLMIGVLAFIGGFITIIHLLILTVKYLVLHLRASPKPAFLQSGLFIIVMNLAVLIGGFAVGAVVQKAAFAYGDAARGAKTSGDYRYVLNETKDGVILEEYFGTKGGDIVIPAMFDGLPVVGIQASLLFSELGKPPYGAKGGKRRERITSVVIPDTVTTIWGGFDRCEELTQITLPKNLKYLGYGTFKGSGITSIVIPEGVTDIGDGAFEDCANLTSVTLPRSLQRVGANAFDSCTSLVDVQFLTIPSGEKIKYGKTVSFLTSGQNGIKLGEGLYFLEEQGNYYGSFKGCTSLSAASKQAIKDSGYTGEF